MPQADAANSERGRRTGPPRVRTWSAVLIGLTAPRAQTILFLPKLEMFGGEAPDAWLAPWVSDAVLGLLVPVALVVLFRLRGPRAWGALLIYNAVGAFDYSHGLLAQYTDPLPESIASGALVYGGIAFGMTVQLAALVLLLRRDVLQHFLARRRVGPLGS